MKPTFTQAQLTILQMLADKGPQPRHPLMQAAAIGHNTMGRVFESLEYRGLVMEGEKPRGRAACLIEITMAGRRALADFEAGTYVELNRVPPPTRNVLQGHYIAPAWMTRNNGHTNIASRGVAC